MVIKRIVVLIMFGVSMHILAMDESNQKHAQTFDQYAEDLMVKTNALAAELASQSHEKSNIDQWVDLMKKSGKLELCIERGFVQDEAAKQDMIKEIGEIDSAFKFYFKSEQKRPALKLLQMTKAVLEGAQFKEDN